MGQIASSKPEVNQTISTKTETEDDDAQILYGYHEEEYLSNPNADIPLAEEIRNIIKQNSYSEYGNQNFSFLTDPSSVTYIYGSKIIFLMKGLPGSGKSTLAKSLHELYKNSAVLSADDYFNENGRYTFDKAKLSDAHNSCKMRAVSAVQNQVPIIVIDNTNVCFWEMKFYVELAKRFNYVVIAVEPNTSWKFDPEQLAARNSHEVPCRLIRDKLKIYQHIRPIYYGWFLNDIDSIFLLNIGKSWLDRCWELSEFCETFTKTCQLNTAEELLRYFSHGNAPINKDRLLHCTSRFTSRWELDDEKYHAEPRVQSSIGKVHILRIIGFIITERTFVARVSLTDEQLPLWGGEDKENVPSPPVPHCDTQSPSRTVSPFKTTSASPPNKRRKKNNHTSPAKTTSEVIIPSNDLESKDISTSATLRVVSMNLSGPLTWGVGSKAHIALGVARGISPVTAGFDLEEVLRLEQTKVPYEHYEIPGGVIKKFSNAAWGVYPHKAIICESIFSHFL